MAALSRTALVLVVFSMSSFSGCVQEMANQPRIEAYEPVEFYDGDTSVRPPMEGTIARGDVITTSVVDTGREQGELTQEIPLELSSELLDRGRERFGIYCAHCHGHSGYGDGLVVQRGFPTPPSYHLDRLRDASPGHFFRVISEGMGRMPSFEKRIDAQDRWAIVAYIEALQLSQNAEVDLLQDSDRQALNASQNNANDTKE